MSTYISKLVDRFLGWKLPQSFSPDCYVTFDRERAKAGESWPIGTNLLTADEARAMLEHILPQLPDNSSEAEGDAYTHGWFDGNEADPYGQPRWRHKARGTHYTELGIAKLQTFAVIDEGVQLVVYRDDDGQLWARPEAEFRDGRFEQVTHGVSASAHQEGAPRP